MSYKPFPNPDYTVMPEPTKKRRRSKNPTMDMDFTKGEEQRRPSPAKEKVLQTVNGLADHKLASIWRRALNTMAYTDKELNYIDRQLRCMEQDAYDPLVLKR